MIRDRQWNQRLAPLFLSWIPVLPAPVPGGACVKSRYFLPPIPVLAPADPSPNLSRIPVCQIGRNLGSPRREAVNRVGVDLAEPLSFQCPQPVKRKGFKQNVVRSSGN